jgi:hypothetical protein
MNTSRYRHLSRWVFRRASSRREVKRIAMKHRAVELRERVDYLKRLAFCTIRAEEAAQASELFHLTGSKAKDIDALLASS